MEKEKFGGALGCVCGGGGGGGSEVSGNRCKQKRVTPTGRQHLKVCYIFDNTCRCFIHHFGDGFVLDFQIVLGTSLA